MIGKIYTLTIRNTDVFMNMREFVHLMGELSNFGVDVDLQKDSTPAEIAFRLKETVKDQ